jgi:hypothetical protein
MGMNAKDSYDNNRKPVNMIKGFIGAINFVSLNL